MKKVFTMVLGLALVGGVSSCKGDNLAEDLADSGMEYYELKLEALEETEALFEEMLEMEDKEFIATYEKLVALDIIH